MIAWLLYAALLGGTGAPLGVPQVGTVKHYGKGTMQRVVANRMNPRHPGYVPTFKPRAGVAGFASRPDCSTIGETFYASVNGSPLLLLQQADCSQARDRQRHKRQGLILEVSYELAQTWGFARSGKARCRVWRAE